MAFAQAPPAVKPASADCLPACRAGYVCLSGQCVNACNPPCSAGTVCNANAECVGAGPPAQPPVALGETPPPPAVAAQPGGYPPPPYGTSAPDGTYPPPAASYAPPPPVGVHLHDGFFLRLGIGFSYTSLQFSNDVADLSTTSGGGAALDITIGGAVRPGLILAGAISGGLYPEPKVRAEGGTSMTAQDQTLQNTRLTFLVDYYSDPQGGFHFGGDFGFGGLSVQNDQTMSSSDHDPFGLTGSVHAGYEIWISDQWSFGGLFRFTYARMWRQESPGYPAFKVAGFEPQILGVFTFN